MVAKESAVTILSKNYSREHSLFYMSVWNEGNIRDRSPILPLNMNNILIIKEPNTNRISVWYDNAELSQFNQRLYEAYLRIPDLFKRLHEDFYLHFNWLFSYFNHDKEIQSLNDLETFYNHLIYFWSPMSIFFVVPNDETFPKEVRKLALDARAVSQNYTDKEDEIFIRFFESKYTQYHDIVYNILPNEIFQLKTRPLNLKELKAIRNRSKGIAILNGDFIPLSKLPIALKERGLRLENEKNEENEKIELQGQVASNAGKKIVEGMIRKIISKERLKTLVKGEILVTTMTSPDFVPAVKLATAIITDEGGITCHAAIVSRELNKPCIIGTKNATKILNDGDYVKLDLQTGVIQKIAH